MVLLLSQNYLIFSKTQNIVYKEDVKADLKTVAVHQQESLFFVQVDKLRPYWINSLWKTSIKLGHDKKKHLPEGTGEQPETDCLRNA